MNKMRILVFAFLSIVVVVSVAFAFSRKDKEISYIQPERRELIENFFVTGKVIPERKAQITALFSGTLAKIYKYENAWVAANEVIAELDNTDLKIQLQQAESSVLQAEARLQQLLTITLPNLKYTLRQNELNLQKAREDFNKEQELLAAKVTTEEAVRKAKQNFESLNLQVENLRSQIAQIEKKQGEYLVLAAQIKQAELQRESIKNRLAQTQLVSPISGVIAARNVDIGDVVAPGKVLFSVVSLDKLMVRAFVDEKYLNILQKDLPAEIRAESYPDKPFAAKLSYIAPAVDDVKGTLEVRFSLENIPEFLKPEMTVSIALITAKRENVLTLPKKYVRDLGKGNPYVVVMDAQQRLVRKNIKTGVSNLEYVEIIDGLDVSDKVVLNFDERKVR